MGDYVCHGEPAVIQRRNPHNYYFDMKREMMGLEMTDKVIEVLDQIFLTSTTYAGGYSDLTDKFESIALKGDLFNELEKKHIRNMLEGMRIWTETVRKL